jgi:hypothetical protein
MGNSLTNSIVRGFGFTIGSKAANSLTRPSTNRPTTNQVIIKSSLPAKQQWKAIGIWILGIFVIGQLHNLFAGAFWFLLGLPISLSIFKMNNRVKIKKEENQMREIYCGEIPSLMEEVKGLPMTFGITEDIITDKTTFEDVKWTYETLNKILSENRPLMRKYDRDTVRKIGMGHYWIGMTEDNLIDMKGNPTKTESKVSKSGINSNTYIYGSKQTGDILKFENGILVSYTDR